MVHEYCPSSTVAGRCKPTAWQSRVAIGRREASKHYKASKPDRNTGHGNGWDPYAACGSGDVSIESDEIEVVVPLVMSLRRLTAPGPVEACCDASLLVVDSDNNGEAVSAEGV